jgi:L-lactate dehydrogenase complex protein LldE
MLPPFAGNPRIPNFFLNRSRQARHCQRQPPIMHVPPNRPVGKKVLMMGTCLCDAFFDSAARACVEILEHLGVEVIYPEDQTCCGQPAFNSGDWKSSRKVARHCAKVFAGDLPVVSPSGSCAAMNFHGNLLQFEDAPDESVTSLANRSWELFDFIVNGLGVTEWQGSLEKPTRAVYHMNCHTRGTPTPDAAIQILSSIDNLEVVPFGESDQCCGFGGTFSVTFPHISGRMGSLKLDHMLEQNPDLLTSADLSCMMHIGGLAQAQGRTLPYRHAAELLRDALPAS